MNWILEGLIICGAIVTIAWLFYSFGFDAGVKACRKQWEKSFQGKGRSE